jgi:hypothetical protein
MKNRKGGVSALLMLLILLGAGMIIADQVLSPEPDTGSGYYDTYPPDYQDSGSASASGEQVCGGLDEPCCYYFDEEDIFRSYYYCYDDLECRADTCVEGPEYDAYDRVRGW